MPIEIIKWSDRFDMHHSIINHQHRNSIALINQMINCYEPTKFVKLIQYYFEAMRVHFDYEEQLLSKSRYPPELIGKHNKEHELFLSDIVATSIKFTSNVIDVKEASRLLASKLLHHLLLDKTYIAYIGK